MDDSFTLLSLSQKKHLALAQGHVDEALRYKRFFLSEMNTVPRPIEEWTSLARRCFQSGVAALGHDFLDALLGSGPERLGPCFRPIHEAFFNTLPILGEVYVESGACAAAPPDQANPYFAYLATQCQFEEKIDLPLDLLSQRTRALAKTTQLAGTALGSSVLPWFGYVAPFFVDDFVPVLVEAWDRFASEPLKTPRSDLTRLLLVEAVGNWCLISKEKKTGSPLIEKRIGKALGLVLDDLCQADPFGAGKLISQIQAYASPEGTIYREASRRLALGVRGLVRSASVGMEEKGAVANQNKFGVPNLQG